MNLQCWLFLHAWPLPHAALSLRPWTSLRLSLPASALFWLAATLAAWLLGTALQKRLGGNALANPVLFAILVLGALLKLTGIPYSAYFTGAQFIHFLLGPATVALAIPLVNSLDHIRRSLRALLPALLAGSLLSALSGYALVRLCGGTREVALSMMPKAATTPIAIGVAEKAGGLPSLTAVLAIAGGILVAVSLKSILRLARITDWRACGFAAGLAGSGIGAAEAIPLDEVAAAFAGLAIGLNGLATSLIVPLLVTLAKHL